MLFPPSPLLLLLIPILLATVTITHAAPPACTKSETVEEDQEMDYSDCSSIRECLQAIHQEEEKLTEKKKELYRPMFLRIDSLRMLNERARGDEAIKVKYWIRWQNEVEDELYGKMEYDSEDEDVDEDDDEDIGMDE